jgi:hypothetical protein
MCCIGYGYGYSSSVSLVLQVHLVRPSQVAHRLFLGDVPKAPRDLRSRRVPVEGVEKGDEDGKEEDSVGYLEGRCDTIDGGTGRVVVARIWGWVKC